MARTDAPNREGYFAVQTERNPEVQKAVVKLRELSADERVRDTYFRREMMRRDIAAQLKQRDIDIAKKLLIRNRPIEEIVEDTGLTREEVEGLRAQ